MQPSRDGMHSPSTLSEHSKDLGELKTLNPDHATEDAANAFAKGDTRLLGVHGFAMEVPGYTGNPYAHKNDIRILKGTGDAFCTKEEEDLDHVARVYAKRYNQAMLFKLQQAGVSFDRAIDTNR